MTPRFEFRLRRQVRTALERYARYQRQTVPMIQRSRFLIGLSRKVLNGL